jgi:hypothetical protein
MVEVEWKAPERLGAVCSRVCIAAAAVLLCSVQIQAQLSPIGNEFIVSSSTDVYGISAAPNGDFVVVWDGGNDGDDSGVFARRYMSNGQAIGAEFQVNTYTPLDQFIPAVAVAGNGSFVVVWVDDTLDGDREGIFGQRYSSGGQSAGSQFQINTYTGNRQLRPRVTAGPDGEFVVVWSEVGYFASSRDGSSSAAFAQRFNSGGQKVGSEFMVNTYTVGAQGIADTATDDAGNFVIVWRSGDFFTGDPGQDGSSYGIFAQRYESGGGRVGTEFQVNTYTVGAQESPAVDVDADGDFVVAWESRAGSVFGQRFASAGLRVGSEFQVNTYTGERAAQPQIALDPDGDFTIVWFDDFDELDGDGRGVLARRYSSSGMVLGSEFLVNTYTQNDQWFAYIASQGDERAVVAWRSAGRALVAQLYGPFQMGDTPTPTHTPTQTPTATPTASATATGTSTPTATPTTTETPTVTPTSTATETPTVTPTATPTPTPAPAAPVLDPSLLPGDERAGGSAEPDLADGCILICAAGPNGQPETSAGPGACGGDDVPVGSGGTDSTGAFQSGGQPGIPLDPPPTNATLLCVFDVCNSIDGNCLLIASAAAAPALSSLPLGVALLVLTGLAAIGILRLRRIS